MDAFDVPLVCYPQQNDIIPMIGDYCFLVIGFIWLFKRFFT